MDISGRINVVSVLPPIASTAVAGQAIFSDYIKMDQYDRVAFVAEWGNFYGAGSTSPCTTGQVTASLWGAYSATGGGARVLAVYTTMGSTAQLATRCDGAAAIIYTGATMNVTGHTLVINGVTFTFSTLAAVTTGTFAATRLIILDAAPDATNIQQTLEHMAAYINHDTYGVTGLHAYVANQKVTITSSSSNHLYISGMGNKIITATAASSFHIKPVGYISILETNGAEISAAGSSQRFVAVALTPSGAAISGVMSAIAIRSKARYCESSTGFVADVGVST